MDNNSALTGLGINPIEVISLISSGDEKEAVAYADGKLDQVALKEAFHETFMPVVIDPNQAKLRIVKS